MAQRSTARRPLIGITAGTRPMMDGAWAGHDAVVLTEHYVRAVREAGARAVVLSVQDAWTEDELAELDGIILTGGTDLDPTLYGGVARVTDFPADPARDAFETELYRTARRIGLPVLAICRGAQIVLVAEGGTLHQHLPEDLPEYPQTGTAPTQVEIEVEPDSDLALALDGRSVVTAFHHQGVRTVGEGLRVVARHRTGLPLALEARSGAPVLAVQWHPELDADAHGLVRSLVQSITHSVGGDVEVGSGLR